MRINRAMVLYIFFIKAINSKRKVKNEMMQIYAVEIFILIKIMADKSRLTFMEFLDHVHLNILL